MSPLTMKRLAKDLTQEQLAKDLNVTKGAVSNWEIGRQRPEAGTYKRYAKALGITTEELVQAVADTISAAKREKAETAAAK